MYEKDPKSLKGKPRAPRYKGEDGQEIVVLCKYHCKD